MSGICTSLIVLAQYLMITFRRGSLFFSPEVWWQIGGPGLIAMLMAPVVFWFLQWMGRVTGYPYLPERERFRMNAGVVSLRVCGFSFSGLLMLMGMRRARPAALVGAGRARRGMDRANSRQLAGDGADSLRSR